VIAEAASCLLAAATAAWDAAGRIVPADARVVVGDVPFDQCCPDGLLLVSVDQLVWFNPFPVEQLGQLPGIAPPRSPCLGHLGAYCTVHMGLCVPVINAQGQPPADEEAVHLALLDLAETIATALACPADECWVLGPVFWAGAQGGCLVAQLQVRIDNQCESCAG
jgi:hypothetical protein